MTTHFAFVTASYAASFIVLLVLAGAIILDGRARNRELAELEKSGIKRRSQRTGTSL